MSAHCAKLCKSGFLHAQYLNRLVLDHSERTLPGTARENLNLLSRGLTLLTENFKSLHDLLVGRSHLFVWSICSTEALEEIIVCYEASSRGLNYLKSSFADHNAGVYQSLLPLSGNPAFKEIRFQRWMSQLILTGANLLAMVEVLKAAWQIQGLVNATSPTFKHRQLVQSQCLAAQLALADKLHCEEVSNRLRARHRSELEELSDQEDDAEHEDNNSYGRAGGVLQNSLGAFRRLLNTWAILSSGSDEGEKIEIGTLTLSFLLSEEFLNHDGWSAGLESSVYKTMFVSPETDIKSYQNDLHGIDDNFEGSNGGQRKIPQRFKSANGVEPLSFKRPPAVPQRRPSLKSTTRPRLRRKKSVTWGPLPDKYGNIRSSSASSLGCQHNHGEASVKDQAQPRERNESQSFKPLSTNKSSMERLEAIECLLRNEIGPLFDSYCSLKPRVSKTGDFSVATYRRLTELVMRDVVIKADEIELRPQDTAARSLRKRLIENANSRLDKLDYTLQLWKEFDKEKQTTSYLKASGSLRASNTSFYEDRRPRSKIENEMRLAGDDSRVHSSPTNLDARFAHSRQKPRRHASERSFDFREECRTEIEAIAELMQAVDRDKREKSQRTSFWPTKCFWRKKPQNRDTCDDYKKNATPLRKKGRGRRGDKEMEVFKADPRDLGRGYGLVRVPMTAEPWAAYSGRHEADVAGKLRNLKKRGSCDGPPRGGRQRNGKSELHGGQAFFCSNEGRFNAWGKRVNEWGRVVE